MDLYEHWMGTQDRLGLELKEKSRKVCDLHIGFA